jgi:hypothetical protein
VLAVLLAWACVVENSDGGALLDHTMSVAHTQPTPLRMQHKVWGVGWHDCLQAL